MASYSFKSVGQTTKNIQELQTAVTRPPIGVVTPMKLSGTGTLLEMHYDLESQLADNLRNLLQTNWGERLGHFDFGANLKPLTTNFVSQDDFDSEAIIRIKSAVARWMPFIDLEDFISEVDRLENKSTGIIKVTISYNIPALNVTGKKIQVVLYVI